MSEGNHRHGPGGHHGKDHEKEHKHDHSHGGGGGGGGGGPTPEQKAAQKAKEEAAQAKKKALKEAQQFYINIIISIGLDPRDYRDIIEQAAKNGWGRETFLKRAGLEDYLGAFEEEEAFLQGVFADYVEAYGVPAPESLVAQLSSMSDEQLGEYNKQLQKILDQKRLQEQTKQEYLGQLTATYIKLWGVAPPPGYVDSIATQGLNIYEFEAQERHKPEFKNSPIWLDEYEDYTGSVLSGFQLI